MCVGPTRGVAERGRPFFRHTLLGGGVGVGVYPEPSCAQAPPTQPGDVLIGLAHPGSLSNGCQVWHQLLALLGFTYIYII